MKETRMSIGSNIEPAKNIPLCLKLLQEQFCVKKISSIYETDPVGTVGKEKFWNLAVIIETELEMEALTKKLRALEEKLGRKRNSADKFSARPIDLDLLPQPGYQNQAFIIIPLAEIIPQALDPESGKTFSDLAKNLAASAKAFRKIYF